MKDNAKRERFKKVAVKRMEKLIADFELLGNCSSLASYEYPDAEVTAIFEEIERQTQILKDRFAGKKAFTLEHKD